MVDYDSPTQPVEYVHRPPAPRRRGCLWRMLTSLIAVLFLVVFAGAIIAGTLVYASFSREIESGIAALEQADQRQVFETTRLFDRDGRLLWEFFGEGKRTRISLEQVPAAMVNATIAVEDDSFYQNDGLDLPALLAALLANLRNPDSRPVGASTITQQLVRHIAFDYDERTNVSYYRKSKEIVLAYIMNQKFSKDEVLELYLNEIYYGNLAYGVEAAAQTYFAKPATELSLAEASLLAALPQSPVELDPLLNLEAARQRQWLVLNLMVEDGNLSQQQAEEAYLQPLTFAAQEVSLAAPHFSIFVRQQLEEMFGADVVANGGLQVTTTLDLEFQRLAELLARQHVAGLVETHNLTNASLVAILPESGQIVAMLGSIDYHDPDIDGQVNVAVSLQQPGSAIKPLVYAAALTPDSAAGEPSWTAADLLWDVPVSYPQFDGSTYQPVNYDDAFHGPVRLRQALANSYNIPAVLLLQDIGVPSFLSFARRLGISSFGEDPANYGLSLTLGGAEVTPLELTAAYAVLANGGYRLPPLAILKVTDSDGQLLYPTESPPAQPETPAVDPRVAFLISDILDDDQARVPAMGRQNPLALSFPAAAKTGTSNDFRDNWTVGYTPHLAVGVWAGNNDNTPMRDVSGLSGAAPLWAAFMEAVYSDPELLQTLQPGAALSPAPFLPPPGLEQRQLCDLSLIVVNQSECRPSGSEWFLEQTISDAPPTPTTEADELVVAWEKIEPAVWRVPALYLASEATESVVALPLEDESDLPPQYFCHFMRGVPLAELPAETAPQLFLQPPRNPESLKAAYAWAFEHNVTMLPAAPCSQELLAARQPSGAGIWRITSPKPDEKVAGIFDVEGIASFDPSIVQFYKVELDLGDDRWVTLGDTHREPVVGGLLEELHAAALAPGVYRLRLLGIRWDGNYASEPATVTFEIVAAD